MGEEGQGARLRDPDRVAALEEVWESIRVEVADNLADRVLVRDAKDRDGGTLAFDPAAWRAFVAEVARRP